MCLYTSSFKLRALFVLVSCYQFGYYLIQSLISYLTLDFRLLCCCFCCCCCCRNAGQSSPATCAIWFCNQDSIYGESCLMFFCSSSTEVQPPQQQIQFCICICASVCAKLDVASSCCCLCYVCKLLDFVSASTTTTTAATATATITIQKRFASRSCISQHCRMETVAQKIIKKIQQKKER